MVLLAPLLVALPLLVLASACLRLGEEGPLGWAGAAALVAAVAWGATRGLRRARRWWGTTKAPVRPTAAGRGRAAAAPGGRSGGTSAG